MALQHASGAVALTDEQFDAALRDHRVVLVDFWATWCGPCRMLGPTIDELAQAYAGRALVAKVDVDQNAVTAQRFNIRSIPTLMCFVQGELVETVRGVVSKAALEAMLDKHLA